MKKIRQFVLLVMVLIVFVTTLTMSAFASEIDSSQIQKFEDGTYIVVTIEYDQSQNSFFPLPVEVSQVAPKNILLICAWE